MQQSFFMPKIMLNRVMFATHCEGGLYPYNLKIVQLTSLNVRMLSYFAKFCKVRKNLF